MSPTRCSCTIKLVISSHWWLVNISSGYGFVLSGTTSLPAPMLKHSVESPSMVDPQWNIWYWGSKWNLHTVCWSAVGCEWGTTSVYFGITYVCFIPSRLPVFAVEPQLLLPGIAYANMLVTTQWPLKRAAHLTSLVWVCVLWLPWKLNGAICAMLFMFDNWFIIYYQIV